MTTQTYRLEVTIRNAMEEVAAETGRDLLADLHDATLLAESGLDSLGFAVLSARLAEQLGCDPFQELPAGHYPTTFAELVQLYERCYPE